MVERASLFNYILPSSDDVTIDASKQHVHAKLVDIFYSYMVKAQQPRDAYTWVSD